MVAASQTTASTGGIWAIVIVAVLALAFWLTAIVLADRSQVRASGRARLAGEVGPVPRGAWAGGSVPGERADDEAVSQGERPTRADIPAQRAGQPTEAGRREMPRQRTGDADRAARSHAEPGTDGDEEPGR
jgi:hypothetical protein